MEHDAAVEISLADPDRWLTHQPGSLRRETPNLRIRKHDGLPFSLIKKHDGA